MALLPAWLRNRLLRFEAVIEAEVSSLAASLPPGTRVLDAGAGEGQYAHHFAACRYVAVDLAVGDAAWDYSRLDAQASLEQLPFRDEEFGAALNIVVLEHTRDPARVLGEIGRVLEPDAPLLLIAPQEWGVHQAPHDYFRFTRHGLDWLLQKAGFGTAAIEPVGGFFVLLERTLLEAALFFQGGWRWLPFPFVALVALPAGLIVPWLDFLDREKNTTLGYVCRVRKR